jgi:hypothetical protein
MTRRERLENKVERRQEWAARRRDKAAPLFARADPYRGDIAFNTQPGHIPERARVIRATDKAIEHSNMADHHEQKAAGLSAQLDRSVFSDDHDAIAQLEARIAEHEATRDRMKKVNAFYKKGDAAALTALGLDLAQLRSRVATVNLSWVKAPYESYQLTNLGARIRTDRERIEQIKQRTARTEQAEAAGGVLIETQPTWNGYCRVTFAEKPARAIIEALKAAGFMWGAGHWSGEHAKLPEGVA